MSMIIINMTCPSCGKISSMNVDEMQYMSYQHGANIQDAFPLMNAFDREVMISGLCHECQEKVFNRPAPGHEALWGNYVGECSCCGSPLYENKNCVGYQQFKCEQCGQISVRDGNGNLM